MMLHSNNMVAKNAKISILIQTLFQPQNIDSISNKAAGPTLNKKYLSSSSKQSLSIVPQGTLRQAHMLYSSSIQSNIISP